MKTAILVVLAMLVALPLLADEERSWGYQYQDGSVQVIYLHDGHDGGVGTFDLNPFVGEIKRVDWIVTKPSENNQLMVGTGLTMELLRLNKLTLSPIAGLGYDITGDDNGSREGHFVFGGSLSLKW
jgi:hypothetical protein